MVYGRTSLSNAEDDGGIGGKSVNDAQGRITS